MTEIYHYGIKRRSGRYPWGSGKRPYQAISFSSIGDFLNSIFSNQKTKEEVLNKKIVNYGSDEYVDKDGPYEKLSDLKKKDPGFKPNLKEDCSAVNKNGTCDESGRSSNCNYCAVAMVMRSKGYDVIARSSDYGISSEDFRTFVDNTFPGAEVESVYRTLKLDYQEELDDPEKSLNEIISKIVDDFMEKQPDGAYGMMTLLWADQSSGHALFYKKENGTVTVYDGQKNEEKDISWYINSKLVYLPSLKFVPLQDNEPSDDVGYLVVSKK